MKFLFRKMYLVFLIPILLGSCTAYKKLPYVKEAETISKEEFEKAAKNYEAKIMPNDELSIIVTTPTIAASSGFNPLYSTQLADDTGLKSPSNNQGQVQTYIVDSQGYINFPILGKLKLGGLTKGEALIMLHDLLYPKYINEEPVINIRFLNYKVTVLGEVAKPGIYTSSNEQMTIFDALASAGDLTIYGKRSNVLLIRENAAGERNIHRIDLQDKNILLDNNIYYLQQNDKIFVEANKSKGNNSQFGTLEGLAISGVSLLLSIISLITR